MIPRDITPAHIRAAMDHIDRDGIPRGRGSRGYDLVHLGRAYPPKYVVALAASAASGVRLAPIPSPNPSMAPRHDGEGRRVFLNLGVRMEK
jgi:hypothetical protein